MTKEYVKGFKDGIKVATIIVVVVSIISWMII